MAHTTIAHALPTATAFHPRPVAALHFGHLALAGTALILFLALAFSTVASPSVWKEKMKN